MGDSRGCGLNIWTKGWKDGTGCGRGNCIWWMYTGKNMKDENILSQYLIKLNNRTDQRENDRGLCLNHTTAASSRWRKVAMDPDNLKSTV